MNKFINVLLKFIALFYEKICYFVVFVFSTKQRRLISFNLDTVKKLCKNTGRKGKSL